MTDLLERWAFAGLAIGLTMTFPLFLSSWKLGKDGVSETGSMKSWLRRFEDIQWWMDFGLPLYMIHQFEEHGIDLLGRWYSFQQVLCDSIGFTDVDQCPMSRMLILFINVGTVWIAGYLARIHLLSFGLNYYGLVFANAVVHILTVAAQGEYGPGILTAVVTFLPACYKVFSLALSNKICGKREVARAIGVGFLAHVVIFASLGLSRVGIINEAAACFIQLLNVLPLAIM